LIVRAASLAAVVAVLVTPSGAGTITFNPTGAGAGAGAISGVSGFGYATSSALALGLPTPAVGATFRVYYESVVNATSGTTSTIGANYSINGSASQFTVIAGFQEKITAIGADGTITLANASGPAFSTSPTTPNFFEILATPAGTVNPSTGAGAGFGGGTVILRGHLAGDLNGAFDLTQVSPGGAPVIGAFNTSGLATTNSTTQSLQGGGGTQLTVKVDFADTNYFVSAPLELMFTTTNSLPFNNVAPLTGFYSAPGASPDINNPAQFNTGTTNGVNGTSLMFQTVANSSFTTPEPSSIIQVVTACTVVPMFLGFRRRRAMKKAA